ncbi:MAG TPA: hypothetical protein VGX23_34735 [Actinocrinis sp.]|nr:hypothetical protein [Actinocrinis sp.]
MAGRLRPPRATSATLLAGLLATAGATHFLAPRGYERIVPAALPGTRKWWVQASGAAELALAAAVAVPQTRRLGALGAAGLFVAVFPANVKMAVDWRHAPTPRKAVAYGRLPLQAPLVGWALRVARTADRRSA